MFEALNCPLIVSNVSRKNTYGFKSYDNVDKDGFIRCEALTTGKLHDSNVFESLFIGTEEAVDADSAYKSEKHDNLLAQHGTDNRILHRAYRNKPLNDEQKQINCYASEVRSTVERAFGTLKRLYGLGKARYLGLARNQSRLSIIAMAHNLKRGVNIQRACT